MNDGSALEDLEEEEEEEEEEVSTKCPVVVSDDVSEVTSLIVVDVPMILNEEVNVMHSLSL